MANSKYEYVRAFEQPDTLLPNTWIVVRIDGRGFHKFSTLHQFTKPNSLPALSLMNAAAHSVMTSLPSIVLAYGVSDEFSFVFHPSTTLFERRASKLVTTIVSTFTAYYVHLWGQYFPEQRLGDDGAVLPTFDGRAVCYPTIGNLRDYCAWRQVDCHINNLYNTTFWALVQQGGMSTTDAERELSGAVAADKNEILYSRFGINYNNEPEIYKKGSVLFRNFELVPVAESLNDSSPTIAELETEVPEVVSKSAAQRESKQRVKAQIVIVHIDIIKNEFWEKRPWILTGKTGKLPT